MSDRYAAAAGLADLADAVRRAASLNVAMSITPAGSSEQDLLDTADRLMVWMAPEESSTQPSFVPPGYGSPL